ncbi:MAG: folate-binding protein YgfZ [Caldilineaceae bacterium]|nr:folate-binding protein YgfZ [Caldilineaceae bacterium]
MTETMIESKRVTHLIEGSALLDQPSAGLLILTGADRADFLHRMTTNEINRLQVGRATVTVLTSSTARILQTFTVLCREDGLWLLPAPDQAANLARHLQGQIFFMDQVKVQNAGADYHRLRLMGPTTAQVLAAAGLAVDELAAEQWDERVVAGETIVVLKQERYAVPGFELIVPVAALPTLQTQLQTAGAVAMDETAYAEQRIALGRPAPGHELTDAYNPLEAGLGWACADDKGCYTGQEIIARQITYDKITKSLVGLHSDELLAVGQDLTVDGRAVGTVTSSVVSAALGPIALAIVKRPHNEPGTQLQAGSHNVQVVALPFVA